MPVKTTITAATSGLYVSDSPVPLEGVDVRVAMSGAHARVTIAQRYCNRESTPIEAVYVFPLDEGAAVCGFEALVNGQRYMAVVKPRDEAFATYDDALADGHGAFLLDEERPDVFTASVGNILPASDVVIELTYVTELAFEGDAIRFALPTTVSPRYAPADDRVAVGRSPEAALNPQTALNVPYGLSFTASVTMPGRISRVESSSHPISVTLTGNTATIALSQETVPLDRDLVIVVGADGTTEPSLLIERDETGRLAAAVTFRPSLPVVEAPADVVFLIDRSGSMAGSSIDSVRHALQLCLRSLGAGCTFDVVSFGSTFSSLFGGLRQYDEASLTEASRHVAELDASFGGTEILPALEFVLTYATRRERTLQLVVLTDGQVTNTDAVLALARQHADTVRIFTFGIGHGASHHLVRGLARAGRGIAEFVAPKDRLEAKVLRQFARLLSPVLTDVSLEWSGIEATVVPHALPPLFNGEPWRAYAWLKVSDATDGHVTLRANGPQEALAWTLPVDPSSIVNGRTVGTLTARARIRELEEISDVGPQRGTRQRDRGASRETREIVDLSTEYGLASRVTSLVTVERRETPTAEVAELRRVPVALTRGWGDHRQKNAIDIGAALCAMPGPGTLGRRRPGRSRDSVGATYGGLPDGAIARLSRRFSISAVPPHGAGARAANRLRDLKQAITSKLKQMDGASDSVDGVIALQHADGSWALDTHLAAAVGRPLPGLIRALEKLNKHVGASREVWATALAVVFLRKRAPRRQPEWQLLVQKAERWLRAKIPDGATEATVWRLAEEALEHE